MHRDFGAADWRYLKSPRSPPPGLPGAAATRRGRGPRSGRPSSSSRDLIGGDRRCGLRPAARPHPGIAIQYLGGMEVRATGSGRGFFSRTRNRSASDDASRRSTRPPAGDTRSAWRMATRNTAACRRSAQGVAKRCRPVQRKIFRTLAHANTLLCVSDGCARRTTGSHGSTGKRYGREIANRLRGQS